MKILNVQMAFMICLIASCLVRPSNQSTADTISVSSVVPASHRFAGRDVFKNQAEELSPFLNTHDIAPNIVEPHVQTVFESFSARGGAAILKLVTIEGYSA